MEWEDGKGREGEMRWEGMREMGGIGAGASFFSLFVFICFYCCYHCNRKVRVGKEMERVGMI